MRKLRRLLILAVTAFVFLGFSGVVSPAQAGPPHGFMRCEVYVLNEEEPVQNGRLYECYY